MTHEYPAQPGTAATSSGTPVFIIVLKDGSQRSAIAAWVQDDNLHFIDTEYRQQVLSSGLLDRQRTDRLNEENHLHLQLPPG